MRKGEKTFILIIVIISIVIIGGLIILKNSRKEAQDNVGQNTTNMSNEVEEYVQKLEDGSKLNVSSEMQKTKTLDGLEIRNIQLKEMGAITMLLADVENKTDSETPEKAVKIQIINKSGNVITELKGKIDSIQAGGTFKLNIAVTADVANAYDFKIMNQ